MSKEDELVLKKRYHEIKKYANEVKDALRKSPLNSSERYELSCQLTFIQLELQKLRLSMEDSYTRRNYIDEILGILVMGESPSFCGR